MAGALARREIVVPDRSALANGFRGYKPEGELVVRKVEVVEDETLRQLKKAFSEYLTLDSPKHHTTNYFYENAVSRIKKLRYSADDVERFSLALGEFQNEKEFPKKAGIFLSVLINMGKDYSYVIHTAHLSERPKYIGYMNTKAITVKGDVGWDFALYMKGGEIHLEGSYERIAVMYHGKIYVNGVLIADY
ncbi:MAG: hypothetical protein PHF60_02100 [Candidatus ainarchaeum sp.]|nr:hypothetical protein [Candidatus ainarchaeum sp.]